MSRLIKALEAAMLSEIDRRIMAMLGQIMPPGDDWHIITTVLAPSGEARTISSLTSPEDTRAILRQVADQYGLHKVSDDSGKCLS